ncbi:MAG: AAA family ATPase [Planctomycetota bacterium]
MKIGDVELQLVAPVTTPVEWIGQQELVEQILACWTTITENDPPLCPRLVSKPGMGKTTLAQATAQRLGRPVYIFQCTMDTRPEDLVVTPVLAADGGVRYHASALVSAMIEGGVVILDEANRMSEKSWASLAPLLDHRRYVESLVAGVRIQASPDFRCCITMNDDASTYEIPEYIISRIQPMVALEYPSEQEELAILQYNVDFAPENLLQMCTEFLQESHRYKLDYSTRDGINIMRYALKLRTVQELSIEEAFERGIQQVLGEGARDFEARAREALIDDNVIDFESMFGWGGGIEGIDGSDDDEGSGGRGDDAPDSGGGGR